MRVISQMGGLRAAGTLARPAALPRVSAAPAATDPIVPPGQVVALAPTRPIAEAARLSPTVSRDSRILARPQLNEARVVNAAFFDRLRPIRVRPVPTDRPDCPAGGAHEQGASGNYILPVNRPGAAGQANWRWCRKCQGLAFGGHAGGVCVKGGQHDFSQSADYVLQHDVAPPNHQTSWRWCRKCDGLAYGGGTGVCPAGGAHDHTGSFDYAIAHAPAEIEGQPDWRWCAKCQSLAYAAGSSGLSREELGLPVATSDPIEDGKLFEAASGPERYHLGRYRLARRVVSGSEQYRIRMAASEDGAWTLEVALERVRPDGLPADTIELDHELLLQLTYRLTTSDGSAISKVLDFTEVGETEDGTLAIARLRFANPAERDQALAAITTAGAGCGLIATRSIRVAVPIAGAPGRFRPVTRGLRQAVEPDPLFLNPALHPYLYNGAIPAGGGPGLEMKQIRHGTRFHNYWVDATNPARVYYLPDSFRLARREGPGPFTPLMTVRPVAGATPDAEPLMAFEFVATPWVDVARIEGAKRELAKALPQPEPAAMPFPTPKPSGFGGVLGAVLGNVMGDLLNGSAEDQRIAQMQLEPLPVEKASFWLALPRAGGGGLAERPAAQVDVRTAVIVAETLPVADFQAVYDALLGGAVAIMKGEVRVELRPGVFERMPFDGQFDQMNGELLAATVTRGEQLGNFAIQLTNAIESPLDVTAVTASLLFDDVEGAAAVLFDPPLPVRLAPGEALMASVAPTQPIPGQLPAGRTIEPLLDFTGVTVVPDAEAIWNAIFDNDTSVESRRTVRVKLFPGMFDAPSGNAADRALAIIVQFEGGASVELTPDTPEAEARLSASLGDLVLGRASAGGYRYKTQIIRRTTRPIDAEWRSDNADLLIPLLPDG